MNQKHRRAQIIDTFTEYIANFMLITERREAFRRSNPVDASGWFSEPEDDFIPHLETVQKRFIHWTTLESQGAIPAALINFGSGGTRREGGAGTEYAALGEWEEHFPIAMTVILKENADASPLYPITDQVADVTYAIERIINGTQDLGGIEGVYEVQMEGLPETTEGKLAVLEGIPVEILFFRIIVVHIYPKNTSV